MLQFRLQKAMDEYVAGVATYYTTNEHMLEIAEQKLADLKEDALKMRAKDLHELLRAWENYHRIITAEAHMKHIQFREESRYPGLLLPHGQELRRRRKLEVLRKLRLRQGNQDLHLLQAGTQGPGGQVQAVQVIDSRRRQNPLIPRIQGF